MGIAHGMWVVEGCGGMCGENGGKNGGKHQFFTAPSSPFFRRSNIFPTIPFVKPSSPHSPTEKREFLPLGDTHPHGS